MAWVGLFKEDLTGQDLHGLLQGFSPKTMIAEILENTNLLYYRNKNHGKKDCRNNFNPLCKKYIEIMNFLSSQ